MTPIADMVAKMLADGIAADLIVLAVGSAEQAMSAVVRGQSADKVDASAERRREKDRLRKRAVRGQSAENLRNSADTSFALSSSSSIVDSEHQEKKERAKRTSGQKLSADWCPKLSHYAEGQALNITRPQVDGMAEDMRLWAQSNEHRAVARKSNWDSTFSGWIRREAPKHGGKNGRASSMATAADNLIARAEEREREASFEGFGSPIPRS